MKDKNVDRELPHFTQRTGTECKDDENKIFTLEALYQAIDRLIDETAIGFDKTSPFILKGCKIAISAHLLIIFRKSFSEGIAPAMWKLANVTPIHQIIDRSPITGHR